MSNDVDNKVVTMTFDNEKFAAKMEETIKGLEKLNQSLKMVEGVKGMADAQKHVNSFKMDGVTKTVGDAQAAMGKFNAEPVVNAVADAQGAVDKFDASNMVDQPDKISAKWVAMAAGIFAVVSGLVTQIGGKLAQIGQGFTLGPLKDGFSEYQTNIGAIQTILANTDRFGTKLPEVTANLDELNKYSDKTIYNFGEMVKNIGLFTNAGIRVGDATSMIKGFSNAAAASGTNAEGAASAAYQLSQALSAGQIRLMDWRSLQNVGMGNKNMQQGLIELADSMGTVADAGLSAKDIQSDFNGSLEKGWLKADVMSQYLKIMAGDLDDAQMATLGLDKKQIEWFKHQQKLGEEAATKVRTLTQLVSTVKESIGSGWSETFRTIVGDFDGATALFTGMNNAISGIVSKSSDARNNLLKGWAAFGGRNAAIEAFVRIWASLLAVLKPIQKAFRQVFPRQTVEGLLFLTDRVRNFTKTLMPAKKTTEAIGRVFKGFFSVVKIVGSVLWQVGKLVVTVFRDLFKGSVQNGVVPFVASIGDVISKVSSFLSEGGRLKNFFAALQSVIHHVIGPVKGLAQIFIALAKVGGIIFGAAMRIVVGLFQKLFGAADKAEGAGGKVLSFFDMITRGTIYAVYYINRFADLLKSLGRFASELGVAITDPIGALKQFKSAIMDKDMIHGPFQEDSPILGFFFNLYDKLSKIKGALKQFKSALMDKDMIHGPFQEDSPILGFFFDLHDKLAKLAPAFNKVWGPLKQFGEAGAAIFDGIKKSITEADWFGMLKDVGHQLYESFMRSIDAHSPSKMFMDAALAIPMGIAEGIKKGWDFVKSGLQWLGDKLGGVFEKVVDFVTSPKLTTALKNGGLFALFKMGMNLSGVFKNLKGFTGEMKNTMKKVTETMDTAKGTLKSYQKSLKWKSLQRIAISVGLLAASMIALSFISPDKLAAGVGGVAAALVGITVSMRQMDKVAGGKKKLAAMATMVRGIATAILILAFAVKVLGEMNDRGDLAQGLVGVGALLTGLTAAILLMGKQEKTFVGVAATLLGLSTALFLLTFAVKKLGEMNDKGDLAQGLVAVGLLLGGLGGAIRLMGSPVTLSGVAMALVGVSIAMLLLTRSVENMGSLEWTVIKNGLIGLGIGMGIIVGTLYAMKKLDLEKASLGLLMMALALNGVARVVQIFGNMDGWDLTKGLAGLAIALLAVTGAIYGIGLVGPEAIAAGAAVVIMAYGLLVLADAIKRFAEMKFGDLAKGLGMMVVAILALGLAFAALGLLSPLILAFGVALTFVGIGVLAFGAGAWLLAEAIKHMCDAGGKGIDLFMKAMDTFVGMMPHWLGVLGDAVVEGLKHFLKGTPELIDMLGVIIGKLLDVANKNLPKFFEFMHNLIHGMIRILKDEQEGMVQAGLGLLLALIQGIGDNADSLADSGAKTVVDLLNGVADAIEKHSQEIGDAGRRIGRAMLDGLINVLLPKEVQEAIGNVVNGMIEWFKNLLGIHSPSTVFAEFGGDILQGLLNGLASMATSVFMFFLELPGKIFNALGDLLNWLVPKGTDLIAGFLTGLWNAFVGVVNFVTSIPGKILNAIGDLGSTLLQKGSDIINGLKNGINNAWTLVSSWIGKLPGKIVNLFGDPLSTLQSTGSNIVEGLKSGISGAWGSFVEWFRKKVGDIPVIGDLALKILSPSRRFMYTGSMIVAGLRKGIADNFPRAYKDVKTNAGLLIEAMDKGLSELSDINPSIAPVIDLTNVKMGVEAIGSMIDGQSINAGVSFDSARQISSATSKSNNEQTNQSGKSDGGVTFVQNNYSPKALSEADIYRKTNGQVARAAKELGLAS